MQKMRFYLDISAQQYLSYYNGSAKIINVQTDYGRTLKFTASELQKYVTRSGIQGRFVVNSMSSINW